MKPETQIKSIKRVAEFGEVNTSIREVNAMLDLVESETRRLDSRFLEPACGDGNFVLEILNRKLKILVKNFKKNQYEFEKHSVVIFSSIYGIDLLEDNIKRAKERLINKFLDLYSRLFKNNINKHLVRTLKFILEKNFIHGDALSLKQVNSQNPIIFCEWSIINEKIKRRDFSFTNLLAYSPFEEGTLFSDLGDQVVIPNPIEEYSAVNFDRVYETC